MHDRLPSVAPGGVVNSAHSAERRPTTAFASAILTQSVTQHNISPRSIRVSAARRTRSTSSSKHPFHNCLPSSAHRRSQACYSVFWFLRLGSDYFLCGVYVLGYEFMFYSRILVEESSFVEQSVIFTAQIIPTKLKIW